MGVAMTKAATGEILSPEVLGQKPRTANAAKPRPAAGADLAAPSAAKKAMRKSSKKPASKKELHKAPFRKRGGEARVISDLVPAVGATAFRKFGFIQSSVVSRWKDIVGLKLAAVTQPAMIRFPAGTKSGGTLHLSICGAHAPMLQHIAPDIVESVNRFFGYAAIAQVRMVHGLATPTPPKPKPEPKPLPQDMSDSLREIADVELRTVLERMAAGLVNTPALPRVR